MHCIPFQEDRKIEIYFNEQINVEAIINIEIKEPKTVTNNLDISKVIRTSHLNKEEKNEILNYVKNLNQYSKMKIVI